MLPVIHPPSPTNDDHPKLTVPNSPRKTKLRKQLSKARSQIYRLRKKTRKLQQQFVRKQQVMQYINNELPPAQAASVHSQFRNNFCNKKGRRWSEEDKYFSMSIFYKSPAAYCQLSQFLVYLLSGPYASGLQV